MTIHSAIATLQYEPVRPQELRKEKNICSLAAIRLQTLPKLSPEERKLRMWNQDSGPDRWCAYERNDFREPRLLHLPIHRKALNSLTQDVWFSLTIIFWYSDYLPFITNFCNKFLAPPFTSWEHSLRVTWDGVSWAWSPENSLRIKHSYQLLGCEYFFKSTGIL